MQTIVLVQAIQIKVNRYLLIKRIGLHPSQLYNAERVVLRPNQGTVDVIAPVG